MINQNQFQQIDIDFQYSTQIIIQTQEMILGKYKSKRKLGKGAYGQVLLVQCEDGQQYAMKLISMRAMKKESYLLDYLEGQIDCMMNIDSPYIMKLYKTQEDEDYKYLLCEYCDGGDLLNLQAKQAGKVFALDKAVEIMAQVIKGLFCLHQAGYLHRDIKSQNILVKMQNGKQTFKLADFGFSKKSTEIGGTVLGTENYMSPEIYKNQLYGFEVDMWAFGVLFYFMLNMEFPFKISPHLAMQKKKIELQKLATNFSYEKLIKTSKKKIAQNCTKQIEDLFQKMFNPDGEQRITFAEIRQHPLFAKYFKIQEFNHASKILYGKKFESKILKKPAQKKKSTQDDQTDNVRQTYSIIKKKDRNFPKQKLTLQTKKDEIDFLRQNALEFYENNEYFKPQERISLSFNLLKYYVILLRQFLQNLTPQNLIKLYPGMQWKDFCKTSEFRQIKTQAQEDKLKNQIKFEQLYDQCSYSVNQIHAINPKFKAAFEKQITDKVFDNAFKQSYRKSTHTSFNTLRSLMKTHKKAGNKLNYNLAILVISHVFNHIFLDQNNMQKIFSDYFKEKSKSVNTIDYSELREWMTKASSGQLNALAKQIIQLYFA